MAIIPLPYGKETLSFEIADDRLKGILRPSGQPHTDLDEQALIQGALENPIASPRLCELAQGKKHILLITSDHTRPVPSALTLPLLLKELRKGSPDAEIIILIATGVHRPTTEEELRAKFSDAIVDRETIVIHRSEADQDMVSLGTLPSGGELRVNRLVRWAELVVSEGFIEPHFFAGFSGGRKSILPGIAARQTVLYNHNAGFISHPEARQGSLEHNPIHQDMRYAANAAGLAFILNVLLDEEKHVIAAVAGEPEKAHMAGTAQSLALTHCAPVSAPIVVVTNGGYPLDQNVYQAVKGLTAAEACVEPGGVIIMCAALSDGHGGEDFYRFFATREGPRAVTRAITGIPPEATQMDQWEAQILARVLEKARCIFVTEAKNRTLIEKMHMQFASSPSQALAMAEDIVGAHAAVTVIPDGVGVIVR